MLLTLLFAQLATAAPSVATPPAARPEVRSGTTKVSGAQRSLADVARERKGKPRPPGAFSAAIFMVPHGEDGDNPRRG